MVETNITIKLADIHPMGLKRYLILRYKPYINKITSILSSKYNEHVDVHYTFLDVDWALDLDFYLVHNKSKFPIANAGNKKLPVCFVIVPPGYKKPDSNKRIIKDESAYFISPPHGIDVIYKKNVNDINWERLFKNTIMKLE